MQIVLSNNLYCIFLPLSSGLLRKQDVVAEKISTQVENRGSPVPLGHSVLMITNSTTSLRSFSNSWGLGKPLSVGGEGSTEQQQSRAPGDWKLLPPEAARQELIQSLCGSLQEVYESSGHNRLWNGAHV